MKVGLFSNGRPCVARTCINNAAIDSNCSQTNGVSKYEQWPCVRVLEYC